jgi:anti-sigma B factor antagonist
VSETTQHPVDVCVTGDEAMIRIQGRMTFVEAHPLRKFCLRMMEQGVMRYVVDVMACSSMDSTFIGVLAMVSLKGKGRGVRVEICGADEQVSGQILGLGLKRIFLFHDRCDASLRAPTTLVGEDDRAAVQGTMLEAHETLVEADAENRSKFKDVLTYLRESSA